MTPAEEDALVKAAIPSGLYPDGNAIRLAIRAAVAAERERCAEIAASDARSHPDDAERIAAAIRRGE